MSVALLEENMHLWVLHNTTPNCDYYLGKEVKNGRTRVKLRPETRSTWINWLSGT